MKKHSRMTIGMVCIHNSGRFGGRDKLLSLELTWNPSLDRMSMPVKPMAPALCSGISLSPSVIWSVPNPSTNKSAPSLLSCVCCWYMCTFVSLTFSFTTLSLSNEDRFHGAFFFFSFLLFRSLIRYFGERQLRRKKRVRSIGWWRAFYRPTYLDRFSLPSPLQPFLACLLCWSLGFNSTRACSPFSTCMKKKKKKKGFWVVGPQSRLLRWLILIDSLSDSTSWFCHFLHVN